MGWLEVRRFGGGGVSTVGIGERHAPTSRQSNTVYFVVLE